MSPGASKRDGRVSNVSKRRFIKSVSHRISGIRTPLIIKAQRFTQQFLLLRLRHAATAQDEASEKVASDFVKGPSDGPANGKEVDDFVKDFREMRRVYHKRAIFVERWTKGDVGWLND
jgi:hypothetical protein